MFLCIARKTVSGSFQKDVGKLFKILEEYTPLIIGMFLKISYGRNIDDIEQNDIISIRPTECFQKRSIKKHHVFYFKKTLKIMIIYHLLFYLVFYPVLSSEIYGMVIRLQQLLTFQL